MLYSNPATVSIPCYFYTSRHHNQYLFMNLGITRGLKKKEKEELLFLFI